ncbi:MAG: DUF58 domain-containing protein [Gammaproteobacteria bacterium]|nr:DUF58 domain-containing protein [Gammaproteobacteria bacterium]
MSLITWLKQFQVPRRNRVDGGELTLHYRRIYILPTGNGVSFGVVLLVMLIGSMNYNLSLGYLLTFLLGGMATASILHTFRNLLGLRLRTGRTSPDFAGGTLEYTLLLESGDERGRWAIELTPEDRDSAPTIIDVGAHGSNEAVLSVAAHRRGMQPLGKVTVSTRYPLGLFRAWSPIEFAQTCPVWPRPAMGAMSAPMTTSTEGGGMSLDSNAGHEDFSGLRQYHSGDSLRHVAWKAVAREQGLLTKQFTGQGDESVWFDWAQLDGLGAEERLAILSRWIIDADRADREYGLRLPGAEIPPNVGSAHRVACLNALARYG